MRGHKGAVGTQRLSPTFLCKHILIDGAPNLGLRFPPDADRLGFVDLAEFERQLRAELAQRQLPFSGTFPHLFDSTGREFFVGNLAQTCAAAPQAEWRRIIRVFVERFESVEKFVSISPDVARKSLRLRLLDLQLDTAEVASPSETPTALGAIRSSVAWTALPGLHWVLFVRRNEVGQNVLPEHLDGWGISKAEAWDLARMQTIGHEAGEFTNYEDMSAYFGESMFTTTDVLNCHSWLTNAPNGLFISVPNRHHVLVRKVDAEGLDLLTNFVQLAKDTFEQGPYPLSRSVWWVPSTGPGEYGEHAEVITPTPVDDNADGHTRYILMPGPQLLRVLDDL